MGKKLSDPIELPCGLTFRNRIVKAALAEGMAKSNVPDSRFETAYENWGSGSWGAIFTGNAQVDIKHLGNPADIAFPGDVAPEELKRQWYAYAAACQSEGTPALIQICHPGRQSPMGAGTRGLFEKTIAPSPLPLNLGSNPVAWIARSLIFGTPREMSLDDIKYAIKKFAEAAEFVHKMGFSGVELHAAHGYLLAQFLSSKSNHRHDSYGGSPSSRVRIVLEIIREIRTRVPPSFCIGIKLNSVDHQESGDLKESLEQIKLIVNEGIDFIEISGGTYEDPKAMMQVHSNNTSEKRSTRSGAREAFFLEFAKVVRRNFPSTILMLTGGFRSRAGMQAAIDDDACDLIGLGRPSVVRPHWPKEELLREDVSDEEVGLLLEAVRPGFLMRHVPIKAIGAGAETEYYAGQIHRLAKGLRPIAPGSTGSL